MMHVNELNTIMSTGIHPLKKRARIFHYLWKQPDHGVAAAVECLLDTSDKRLVSYVAQFLAQRPGDAEAKTTVAKRLRREAYVCGKAGRLVPWLPGELLDGFIADYLALPDPESIPYEDPWYGLGDVVHDIALHDPDRVRPFADQIADEFTLQLLVCGSPDAVVDEYIQQWRKEADPELIETVARVRTDHAVQQLRVLREEFAEPGEWQRLVQLAGELPDSGKSSGYRPAHMGFVVDAGESEHVLGGQVSGEVPVCMVCETPAVHLLTLSAAALPEFGLTRDPTFYWYPCNGCDEMDFTTVRLGAEGITAYYGPKGPADPDAPGVIPGPRRTGAPRALALERHPTQRCQSASLAGFAHHQVGGLPGWLEPHIHPGCPECGNSMPYLATVSSGHTAFGDLSFKGHVFGFWCDDCHVSSTLFQRPL